jgi:hypothetical protein
LQCINYPLQPVLEEIGHVPDRVAVREKIPATGPVAVIVEPRAEDEVCSGAEEETEAVVSKIRHEAYMVKKGTYMIINQVKNPQCPEEFSRLRA